MSKSDSQKVEWQDSAAASVEDGCSSLDTSLSPGDDSVDRGTLTLLEIRNLSFALLAWACTISNVTLVVGTSAVVILSLGADNSIASIPLGAFFIGASLVSLTITPWLFKCWGRQKGFLVGVAFGLFGTSLGGIAVALKSPVLLIVASLFFGMATGVGFFWRFASVETVPSSWAARAVTLVVSGGCFAAFAGPESARATRNQFGNIKEDPHLEYLGVFIMTGVFNLLNLLFTLLVQFPKAEDSVADPNCIKDGPERTHEVPTLGSLLRTRQFLVPMSVAGLSWAIMTVPMSLLAVAMAQVGFSARQSLTVIELHFLGMYAPGFVTGSLIQRYGPAKNCSIAAVFFAVALACMIFADPFEEGRKSKIALWVVGMILIGVGWNLGFTSATVWLTDLYRSAPELKGRVQASNDSCMFCFAGVWIVSAGYIFEAGGSGLDGWRLLNKVIVSLLLLYALVLIVNWYLEHGGKRLRTNEQRGSTENKPQTQRGRRCGIAVPCCRAHPAS